MMFLDEVLNFLLSLDQKRFFQFFWYFVVFDFTRYVVFDTVVLILHFLRRWQRRETRRKARIQMFREKPLVSVIAPGKNEGKHIPALVRSLQKQTYKNFELIIVDDGSDDNSAVICRQLQKQGAIDKFFRNNYRGGKASAANLALHYAKGEFVIHLDADTHLTETSVEKIILPFFINKKIGAVGGDIRVNNIGVSPTATLQAFDYMKTISTGRLVASYFNILRIVSGAYGAFRKDILLRLGGWDVGPGMDGDIVLKIRKLGFKVVHEPEAICYTNVPTTFAKLAKQRYRWDRSMIRFRIRKHRDLLSLANKNFSISNFFTSLDGISFNLILNLKWWIYIFQIVIFSPSVMFFIFPVNYVLYLISNVHEYLMTTILYGDTIRKKELQMAFYLPLMPLYTGIFLRIVRSYAYMMEFFFKASFYDLWNPWKVSRSVIKRKY